MRQALETIAKKFEGIEFEALTTMEHQILTRACDALGWKFSTDIFGEIKLVMPKEDAA